MSVSGVLEIKDLKVSFSNGGRKAEAVRGVNLTVEKGRIHSLVGESGSGKTVTSTAVMGLLPQPPASIEGGRVLFNNRDLFSLTPEERRLTRGREMAMIFQEPSRYLNPAFRAGSQITEMLRLHMGLNRPEARSRAQEILELVGLGADGRVLSSYPHELSGGMKQRVMIAMAVCCNPSLLIADEPTTALDVTLQRQILRLISDLRDAMSMGVLFISHDLAVVHDISDSVSVIYAGRIVETGTRDQVFGFPLHPYTRLLLASVPDASKRGRRLASISGRVPDAEALPSGCAFHPRCPIADERCRNECPVLQMSEKGHGAECFRAGEVF